MKNIQPCCYGMINTMDIEENVRIVRGIGQNHDDKKWRDDSNAFGGDIKKFVRIIPNRNKTMRLFD